MNNNFRPMLACSVTDYEQFNKCRFPLFASVKIDGVRGMTILVDGKVKAVTRQMKPIPNLFIRETIESWEIPYLDFEITTFDEDSREVDLFNVVSQKVRTFEGNPLFIANVFDNFATTHAFQQRMHNITLAKCHGTVPKQLLFLSHQGLNKSEEVIDCINYYEQQNVEGVMFRGAFSLYKYGRSTFKDQCLLRVKFLEESIGTIIGINQKQVNLNKLTRDSFGLAERSSHQANLLPVEEMGSLTVELPSGVVFNVGTGFTAEDRRMYWNNFDLYKGRKCRVKHQAFGMKTKPRQPVFIGLEP